jgi:cell division protein FtsN
VQLAAYTKKDEADGLVARLVAKGIEARVDGDAAPFRVRVGRFALRAEAAKRLTELKAQGYDGFIAELPRAAGRR